MATISCKCDTCKRQVEIVENPYGMSIIGRCTITNGCRGKLYQLDRNPNTARGANISKVPGIENYVPRKTFEQHTQSLANKRWVFEHGLGVLPATFVYTTDPTTGKYVQMDINEYTVEPLNENTIYINFSTAQKGIAQCVARSSVPFKPDTFEPDPDSVQVSANGVITFGVPRYLTTSDLPPITNVILPLDLCGQTTIKIEVEITRPNEEPMVCFESLENLIDVRSPWNGWGGTLVEARRDYCLRTAAILKLHAFGSADLVEDDIPNGTRIRFLRIDYGTGRPVNIPSRGLLMFLSNKPYEYVDKNRELIVDIGELAGSDNNYFTYMDGELFLSESLIESTYPMIERVFVKVVPPQPSITPTPTHTLPPAASVTPTPTISLTPTVTHTAPVSQTPTPTVTASITPTISLTPSHTVTPTPTTSQNAVSLDFDYAIVRFTWREPNGTDLDIRVDITDPSRNVIVGADRNISDSTFLTWGGDNQTAYGQEAVLIDFKSLMENYTSQLNFYIRLRAFWYGIKTDGNMRIDFVSYKGGTMIQTPQHDFINSGGQLVDQKSVWVNSQMQGGLELNGDEVAGLDFNVLTQRGELIVIQPAVTPTPTATVSLTRTPTLTPLVTQTATPTMTRTPTLTPQDTTTPTPTVTRTQTGSAPPTPTITRTNTPTPETTKSMTPTITRTITPTISITPTNTPTQTLTPTITATQTLTPTVTPTITMTQTLTPSISVTPSITPEVTPTNTMTLTPEVTPTLTPSITPTLTPTLTFTPTPTPTTSENAVSLDFDYAVIRYIWSTPNGTDLDIRVDITEPPRFVIVGADRNNNDGTYLTWGGDNQTAYGQEAVLIDFQQLIQDYPTQDDFRIRLRAFWYGVKLDGNMRVEYVSYKGGSMELTPSHDFINIGGSEVDHKSVWVNSQMQGGLELNGDDVAYLDFNVISNSGELIVAQPAVTPTATPTVTPTITFTSTNTPTPTMTRTPTLTPMVTPSTTSNVTPSVTPTISVTPTMTRTQTRTPTITPTETPEISPSVTAAVTPSVTLSRTYTPTPTITPTVTLTPSVTVTLTPTPENTKSATPTVTPTITATISITPTISLTPTITRTITPTISLTPTLTPTISVTPSVTATSTATPTPTPTPSPSEMAIYFLDGSEFNDLGEDTIDGGHFTDILTDEYDAGGFDT